MAPERSRALNDEQSMPRATVAGQLQGDDVGGVLRLCGGDSPNVFLEPWESSPG